MAAAVQSVSERASRRINPGMVGLILLVVVWGLTAIYAGSPLPLRLVTGNSMAPTFRNGDVALVKRVSFSDIAVGDVVAFEANGPTGSDPPEIMLRRVVDIGVLADELVLATMRENGAVDQHVVRSEQIEGVAVLKVKAIGWPLTMFDDRNAMFISLGSLFALLLLLALLVLYLSLRRKGEPAVSQPIAPQYAPSPVWEDEDVGDERDELRETITRLSEKIEEIESRQTEPPPEPQHADSPPPPVPDQGRASLSPPQQSLGRREIEIDPTPIADMLGDPDPGPLQETAQPQEQDPPEEVEPPQEPTETSAPASRPTRGQQAFITLSDEELAGLNLETPDIQPDIDREPAPPREAYSGSQIDIELEPPTIKLFDEYRRVTDLVGERSAVRFDAIGDDEFDRIVSRTIDIEMPLHLALLRDRMADYYGVRDDDALLQRRLDGVVAALVSQERAAWEQVDGSLAARGQFLSNPDFDSGISPRRPRQDEPQRDIRRVAISELQAGVASVMWAMYTASRSVLIAETARQFGYVRLDGPMHDRIGLAIDRMIQDGRLLDQSGGLTLKD
ncbi:MAG: S26 family signal peptidase [SAR202 cluster bacterium]|jgi:signal peptidase I|nr:S26 family signal peptidase [SAR202 cluster bacterium]MDP6514806.1 S26 family signal peptidase [SAR202 cluster bacterium]